MKKTVSAFIFLFFYLLMTGNIFACDCIKLEANEPKELIEHAYKTSEAVFSGQVIQIEKIKGSSFVKVRFKIEKSWKNISQEALIVTSDSDEDCGYKFKVGDKYLVYAQGKTKNLEIAACSRTAILESNNDVDFLNKIKTPASISSPK